MLYGTEVMVTEPRSYWWRLETQTGSTYVEVSRYDLPWLPWIPRCVVWNATLFASHNILPSIGYDKKHTIFLHSNIFKVQFSFYPGTLFYSPAKNARLVSCVRLFIVHPATDKDLRLKLMSAHLYGGRRQVPLYIYTHIEMQFIPWFPS